MIEAKIVADSLAPSGKRLTTFVLTYPRFIHSEFMTHRMFSRNASSSRAIPVKKQIQMVIDNPAIPLAFHKNKSGMQAGARLEDQDAAVRTWLKGRDRAVAIAAEFVNQDVHKQYANRVLEPYAHITVVCSATDYANFFALRLHPMAQPEICELAKQMWEAYQASEPKKLEVGQWHLPFVEGQPETKEWDSGFQNEQRNEEGWSAEIQLGYEFDDQLVKQSVARCARVSYLNHEGKNPTLEEDLALYDRLLGQLPIHASPAEHQAMAIEENERSGNFIGWVQYRKTLENENIEKFEGPIEN